MTQTEALAGRSAHQPKENEMITRDYEPPRIPPIELDPRDQGQNWAYANDVIARGDYPPSFVASDASRWHLQKDGSGDLIYVREDGR